ncbi:MAG: DUF3131 domain-containing protein [Desulfovibrio sp.]
MPNRTYDHFKSHENKELEEQEIAFAQAAWGYLERVYFPETGLVQGAVGSDSVTVSDIGDYLAALLCAHQLGVADDVVFNSRMTALTVFLNTMPLNEYGVFNKHYNSRTGKMLRPDGQEGAAGFSALDTGRLLMWLRVARNKYIAYAAAIDRAVMRINFRHLLDADGLLYGAIPAPDGMQIYREGRLGTLQYAAKGYAAWGFSVKASEQYQDYAVTTLYGRWLPFDNRQAGYPPQFSAVTTRPFVLPIIEFGIEEGPAYELASSVFAAQKSRYVQDGRLTARDVHSMDRPPYYVLDSVYAEGMPFVTLRMDGVQQPDGACVNTGAAFLLWALSAEDFTNDLITSIETLYDQFGGWFAGTYEQDGSVNRSISLKDNAMILEALAYKAHGPLCIIEPQEGYWEKTLEAEPDEEKGLPPTLYQQDYQPLLPRPKAKPGPWTAVSHR